MQISKIPTRKHQKTTYKQIINNIIKYKKYNIILCLGVI